MNSPIFQHYGSSFYNFNFNYRTGGYAYLLPSWRAYNVQIDESKLFYITEGECIIRSFGKETVCKKGDIVLVPAGLKHDYYLSENGYCEKYWLMVKFTAQEDSFFNGYDLPIRFFSGDNSVKALFKTAVEPVKTKSDALKQANAVFSIVSYYINQCAPVEKDVEKDTINGAIHYIYNNLSVPTTLKTLAHITHLSPNYFVRAFKQRTGLSPMKMLTMARLDRAKFLLSDSDKPIAEIMESIGFSDSSYFCKSFKSYTGFSPREYRKATRKKP